MMEAWWIYVFCIAVVAWLWAIAKNTEKVAKEAEATRQILAGVFAGDFGKSSELQRVMYAVEALAKMEAEKRPPLGRAID